MKFKSIGMMLGILIFALSIFLASYTTYGIWILLVVILVIGALLVKISNRATGFRFASYALIPLMAYVLSVGVRIGFAKTYASMHSVDASSNIASVPDKVSKTSPAILQNLSPTTTAVATTATATTDDGSWHIGPSTLKGIPIPDAPARPNEGVSTASITTTVAGPIIPEPTVRYCKYAVESRRDGFVQFQSGDYFFTLIRCEQKGDVIQFSGTVQYQGPGTGSAAFGEIVVTGSPSGKVYPLGKAYFGEDVYSFGRGYSQQSLDHGAAKGFYAEVTSVDDSPITVAFSIRSKFGDSPSKNVSFQGLTLGD